ncbi:hypothetical protein PGTUg99_031009 [Puccinia graminis f. sp. tritici]|uniref:CxC1-like cysteine cluster associated with KDZ transposases domain-containing protein n=1 Tax=Puccinia graminis f. sp. tritici TaxID=56615 RepID=A0A5B0QRV1_PUCGR|nr:hypothetical protein PGTUg99_031009 [Puccinia graminis f. sp. tritici]
MSDRLISTFKAMTRPVRNASNRINATISTGSSQHRRVRRRPNPEDVTEQVRFDQSIQSGRRAGVIPPPPQPHNHHQAGIESTENDIGEAFVGEYPDQDFNNPQENQDHDDAMLHEHAAYHRLLRHAENREKLSRQWSQLEAQAASTYLMCQEATSNWTDNIINQFEVPPNTCTCRPDDIIQRHVDLIDILSHQPRHSVTFCKCIPDVIRLIHYGYFAASAEKPRTAFSIRLIQYHHFMWQTSVISVSAFVKGLSAFLDTRSTRPMFARSVHYRKRNLRIPFSYATDLYCRILVLEKKILNDGLQLTNTDHWANKCPCCFGPNIDEVKVDPNEPDFIIAIDGNFQQRHYAHSSKDNPREDQYPPSFIQPSKITPDANALEASESLAQGINVSLFICLTIQLS